MTNEIIALGLMSGTSLDGLDLALCKFYLKHNTWHYEVLKATTVSYTDEWKEKLSKAQNLSALEFALLHNSYGRLLAENANQFLANEEIKPQIIASHGHTIFHQPEKNLTVQIGSGAEIAASTGITTVFDFRSLDVALGGQGAPLVPIGDELLFAQYDICLNLGGFANYSVKTDKRIACDAGVFNFVLNAYSQLLGSEYDAFGNLGKSGEVHTPLLQKLNQLAIYQQKGPKSLSREWVEKEVFPLINSFNISIEDKLAAYYEHFSQQLATELMQYGKKKVLVSGGGAYNEWFIELLRKKTTLEIIIPDKVTIEYKEAIIFAFLGVLRYFEQTNTLCSVSGASKNSIGGAIFLP